MAYQDVGSAGELPAGGRRGYDLDGKRLALFRQADRLYAVEDTCPHQGGPLSEGEVRDGQVVCPWHRWTFDLASGECKTRPSCRIGAFAVREQDGRLQVDLEARPSAPAPAPPAPAAPAASAPTPAAPAAPAAAAPAAVAPAAQAAPAARPGPRDVTAGTGFKFLAKSRGEAVKHLLGFLGRSGDHLEPKTKYLIYCAVQTMNFSERGLRQYIPKAIEAGASEDEVIDAILQAYPGGGLGRVVDALDVFLSLGYGGELPG